MELFINNKKQSFDKELLLSQLLEELNMLDQKGLAVAVNNKVISKVTWDSYQLKSEDKLTIIRATQGG